MIPRQTSRFNERRNSSRVWPVTEQDVANAHRELARFRATSPRTVAWIEAGAPAIRTAEEHERWFGCEYKRGVLT